MTVYDEPFYASRDADTRHAAQRLLPPVIEAIGARSVTDVGCGVGTWLAVALEAGAGTIAGFEGPWLDPAHLVVDREAVTFGDLEEPLKTDGHADLAICLEVAEHLSEARASGLVHDLAALADVVLFGAAIPGQGGDHHINEQWQSWWAALFEAEGLMPFDVVRPAIWTDEAIPFWYRQNPLVYARPGSRRAAALEALGPSGLIDLVHPELYRRKARQPGVRTSVRQLGQAVGRLATTRSGS